MIKINNVRNNYIQNNKFQSNKQVHNSQNTNNIESKNISSHLLQMASINKSLINFAGKNKLNKRDNLLIDTISNDFELKAEEKEKLTKSLSSYLASKNLKSLDNIIDDKDGIDPLVDEFSDILQFKDADKSAEFHMLIHRLVERKNFGKDYSLPEELSINDFKLNDDDNLITFDANDDNPLKKMFEESQKDQKYHQTIIYFLGLNEREADKYLNMTYDYIGMSGSGSLLLSEQFKTDDEINSVDNKDIKQGYIAQNEKVEKYYNKYLNALKKDFNLTDKDIQLIDSEYKNRIHSDDMYSPRIHPLDRKCQTIHRDTELFKYVTRELFDNNEFVSNTCLYLLKEDANQNNLTSIFDLFKNKNSSYSLSNFEKGLDLFFDNKDLKNLVENFFKEIGKDVNGYYDMVQTLKHANEMKANIVNSIANENKLSDSEIVMIINGLSMFKPDEGQN